MSIDRIGFSSKSVQKKKKESFHPTFSEKTARAYLLHYVIEWL